MKFHIPPRQAAYAIKLDAPALLSSGIFTLSFAFYAAHRDICKRNQQSSRTFHNFARTAIIKCVTINELLNKAKGHIVGSPEVIIMHVLSVIIIVAVIIAAAVIGYKAGFTAGSKQKDKN